MDKRKDSGIHKISAIMEYIAKKFGWGIDIKWFNSYRAATDDVLMIKLINQKENLTTEVKSKMKKLNITKEAFEKSNYFTKKYGKLEYVSESGKLFKTDKGQLLKFKESLDDFDYDLLDSDIGRKVVSKSIFDDIDDGIIKRNYLGIRGLSFGKYSDGQKFLSYNGEEALYDDFKNLIQSSIPESDGSNAKFNKWINNPKNKMTIKKLLPKIDWYENDDSVWESTKKFGRKFMKESCDEEFDRYYERMKKIFRYDSGIHIRLRDNEDGSETIEVTFDDRFNWNDDVVSGRIPLDEDSGLLDWITRFDEQAHRNGWEFDFDIAKDIENPIDGGANNDYLAMLTLTCKCDKKEDDLLFESSDEKLDNPEALIKFIRGLPDGDEYLFQDGGKWIATNEWLCGTFAGKEFEGDTEEEAVQQLIDYLNLHIGHNSMVGQNVTKSGWPIASKVAEYVGPEEEEVDESAMPLKGDQETGTMAKVNDLVSKAYASLYDELKKAGIDFDAASDDGFYVNDPEAKKTYFINLYVNECQEYEGSYRADESKKKTVSESINLSGVKMEPMDDGTQVLTRRCPSCGNSHSITVQKKDFFDGMRKLKNGERMQNAFPTLTPDEREFLTTGICSKC